MNDIAETVTQIVCKAALFTPEECDQIVDTYKDQGFDTATIMPDRRGLENPRNSEVSFVEINDASRWVFQRLEACLVDANTKFYQFDISRFEGALQLTRYGAGQYYGPHIDLGGGPIARRKISVTVQLSAPDQYEGGDLLFSPSVFTALREKGSVCIFPSFLMHQVTPVTRGVRHSLVAWILGEQPFR